MHIEKGVDYVEGLVVINWRVLTDQLRSRCKFSSNLTRMWICCVNRGPLYTSLVRLNMAKVQNISKTTWLTQIKGLIKESWRIPTMAVEPPQKVILTHEWGDKFLENVYEHRRSMIWVCTKNINYFMIASDRFCKLLPHVQGIFCFDASLCSQNAQFQIKSNLLNLKWLILIEKRLHLCLNIAEIWSKFYSKTM